MKNSSTDLRTKGEIKGFGCFADSEQLLGKADS